MISLIVSIVLLVYRFHYSRYIETKVHSNRDDISTCQNFPNACNSTYRPDHGKDVIKFDIFQASARIRQQAYPNFMYPPAYVHAFHVFLSTGILFGWPGKSIEICINDFASGNGEKHFYCYNVPILFFLFVLVFFSLFTLFVCFRVFFLAFLFLFIKNLESFGVVRHHAFVTGRMRMCTRICVCTDMYMCVYVLCRNTRVH